MINQNRILDLTGIIQVKPLQFYGRYFLKKIIIGNTLEKIGDYAFLGCENLKELRKGCFKDFSSLYFIDIDITSDLRIISLNSFDNCSSLEMIKCNYILKIDACAFSNCNKLKLIELSDYLEEISISAFHRIPKNNKLTTFFNNTFKKIFPNANLKKCPDIFNNLK